MDRNIAPLKSLLQKCIVLGISHTLCQYVAFWGYFLCTAISQSSIHYLFLRSLPYPPLLSTPLLPQEGKQETQLSQTECSWHHKNMNAVHSVNFDYFNASVSLDRSEAVCPLVYVSVTLDWSEVWCSLPVNLCLRQSRPVGGRMSSTCLLVYVSVSLDRSEVECPLPVCC